MTIPGETIEKIEQELGRAESIDYAFLFGSALRRLLPESDIDILIGGTIDFDGKMLLTVKLSTLLKRHVDLVVTREARCELVIEAMSKGRLIFVKDRDSLKRDYLRNWRRLDDNTGLRRMRIERIKQQYVYGR
jgi:predicted nucleotidyltransferase